MAAPVLAYENLGLVQGAGWLFRGLDLFIGERDRLALIGRNGAGKTTLLKCLAGLIETDEGRRTIRPGIKVVLLEQDPDVADFATLARLRAGRRRARRTRSRRSPTRSESTSTARQRRPRAASGAAPRSPGALAQDPQVLLLDEPTNHLDLAAIEWLEDWLAATPAPSSRSATTAPS